jgi:hypothetical protein
MKEGYSIFCDQLEQVIQRYPNLEVSSEDGEKFLRGSLEVVDDNGKSWDTYLVEVKYKEEFPYRFPKVFEISGKIPKIADWHIYRDGSCCIDVLPSEIIKCAGGINSTSFIEEELIPYLFNQTYRKVEGYYTGGEYSHGLMGIYEFFSSILRTESDIGKTLALMHYIATEPRLNRSNKCFCGSNELFRKCHMQAYDELSKLDKIFLLEQINTIYKQSGVGKLDRLKEAWK